MASRLWTGKVLAFSPGILPQPLSIPSFIKRARCEGRDSLRGILLAGLEFETVKFEKENANHKASPLVSVYKRMVANHSRGVESCHLYEIRGIGVRMVLPWPSKSGLKKPSIAQP
jgi:hypothetical protein